MPPRAKRARDEVPAPAPPPSLPDWLVLLARGGLQVSADMVPLVTAVAEEVRGNMKRAMLAYESEQAVDALQAAESLLLKLTRAGDELRAGAAETVIEDSGVSVAFRPTAFDVSCDTFDLQFKRADGQDVLDKATELARWVRDAVQAVKQ